MTWRDLAFLHWPVAAETLRPLVPPTLALDTFGDTAWIAVTPFRMTRVRPRFLPPIPTASDFPELNVRTYVTHGGRAGVWFFSLDAGSALAVVAARGAVGLPYHRARMSHRMDGEDVVFTSTRLASAAEFSARYRPAGPVFRSAPGSFEHWCTERYSLFSTHAGTLLRLDIEHVPWPLQPAEVRVERNTVLPSGIAIPDRLPHVLYSRTLDVVAQLPTRA